MSATSGQLRAADFPPRRPYTFELVKVVRQSKPTALVECLDCGGTLLPGDGQGFLCTICSSRWRSRWTPSRGGSNSSCSFCPGGTAGNDIESNVRSPLLGTDYRCVDGRTLPCAAFGPVNTNARQERLARKGKQS